MAMDLIDAGEGEEITEEVSEEVKVEASRQRRNRRSQRAEFSRGRSARPERRELSATDKMEQRLNRLERSNRALRSQLREFGAAPATRGVRTAPTQLSQSKVKPNLSAPTAAALEMINNYR
jgi:hypothetical protein